MSKFVSTYKAMFREKFIAINAYIRKEGRFKKQLSKNPDWGARKIKAN